AKDVSLIESKINKGLANSVIDGVTSIVNNYGKVIVIEDDIIVSKSFLQYMNDALNLYENDEQVWSIGSWNYFARSIKSNFLFRVPESIAWATNKNAWSKLNTDSNYLVKEIEKNDLINEFNINGSLDFYNMLCLQKEGKVDSWAIRWYASAFLDKGLCFYPQQSLSKHMGHGPNATNVLNDQDPFFQNFEVDNATFKLRKKLLDENLKVLDLFKIFHRPNTRKI
ncbi:MAG: hypothetical protein ABI285_08550, partial [Ginsengibacter sp.]